MERPLVERCGHQLFCDLDMALRKPLLKGLLARRKDLKLICTSATRDAAARSFLDLS